MLVLFYGLTLSSDTAKKKVLTFQDIMEFKEINNAAMSADGEWVVYNAQPDRGNGEVIVYGVSSDKSFTIERGIKPVISKDGKWAAALIKPDALTLEKAKKKDKPEQGMTLLETTTGKITTFEKIKKFAFSDDSRRLVYQFLPEKEKEEEEEEEEEEDTGEENKKQAKKAPAKETIEKTAKESGKKKKKKNEWDKKAVSIVLRDLNGGKEIHIEKAVAYAFDPAGRYFVYSTYNGADKLNCLFVKDLKNAAAPALTLQEEEGAVFNNFSWSKKKSKLAFLFHYCNKKAKKIKTDEKNKKKNKYSPGLYVFDGMAKKQRPLVLKGDIPTGWMLPAENKFTWTEDEQRLFFGFKPIDEYKFYKKNEKTAEDKEKEKEKLKEKDLYSSDYLLKKKSVDVWHWLDPQINPQQKKRWERSKKRIYLSVYHLKKKRLVQLADKEVPRVLPVDNPKFTLAVSQQPYMRETTWDDSYYDIYLQDLEHGSRQKILSRFSGEFNPRRRRRDLYISPAGKYAAYYKNKTWYLLDTRSGKTRNLTGAISTPFYDEDHDYPYAVPGYGAAGWTEKDKALLIYDKYDIRQFETASGKAQNMTRSRSSKAKLRFRIITTNPEQKFFQKNENLLLGAYSYREKHTNFYSFTLGKVGVRQLTGGKKRFRFKVEAKKTGRILFTREDFSEFPDLWVSDPGFKSPRRITSLNPQITDFAWGQPKLIEWRNLDGVPLQGIVILPENYDKNKRYPVLVYFYRFFTQRLYDFNRMVVNHRPNFPFYCSNGYVMFLPDVRFRVGQPGYSATKCVVTGVKKLIDLGIADPKAVALHGHSWSGYQAAFIITQTDIFAAAIAGAPVANMTSAYSGIRWSSGMARQFQYEKSQSRIGKSLWESPRLYIENSPVFFADRISTPLLIQHGDKDGAVPWYQAIELYLAMRRLNKDCIFLQYNDEPHHLQKYPNKLDYSIKMKQYLDHYLKGEPAPDWIKKGTPYKKK